MRIKIIIPIILITIIALGTGIYFYINYQFNLPASPSDIEKTFVVKQGQGVKQISRYLENDDLIRNSFYFELYVWKEGLTKKLQAGEYLFRPNMTIEEIVDALVQGKVVSNELQVTIPEGLTVREIELKLVEADLVKEGGLAIFSAASEYRDIYEFLKDLSEGVGLEGFLFPDTYNLYKDTTPKEILEKMLDNFDQKLTAQMRLDIKNQNKSIYEVVIMASLLEKEVRTYEDRRIVAGIFWKRLKNNYPLESCATIAYVLGTDKWRYSYEDTRIKSPYNTYINIGLPLGPICNPGLTSIKAAIYPEGSDYHYFLTRPDTGQTVFSKTLKEHNINKAKYFK